MESTLARRQVMSQGYGIIPKKVMRDKRLKPEAKAIYAYLCSFAGNDNVAYPSVSLMCEELCMSIERFYKYRKQLEEFGYLEVSRLKGSEGKFEKNVYVLTDGDIAENPYTENTQTNKKSSTNSSSNKNRKEKTEAKRKRFATPTVEEVDAYIKEKGYGINAQEFIDKNEMRGWKQNNGMPIVDWKACVRVFETNRKRWESEKKPRQKGKVSFEDVPEAYRWGV